MSDKKTEDKLNELGLNAPRLTPEVIDGAIAKKEFHVLSGTLTVCVLTLTNGYKVTGESACASVENFNQEVGEDVSFKNAREKIWGLVGFLLVDFLSVNKVDLFKDNKTLTEEDESTDDEVACCGECSQ